MTTDYIDENKWRDDLSRLLDQYKQLLAEVNTRLRNTPPGRLEINRSKEQVQYFHCLSEKRDYLNPSESMNQIIQLANKGYYLKLKNQLEGKIAFAERTLKQAERPSIYGLYDSMIPPRQELIIQNKKVLLSEEQYIADWLNREYTPLGFREGDPEFYSARGLRVRSRIEGMIVDRLDYFKIPFLYEYPLRLRGFGDTRPDFLILNRRTREEFIWEHFGKMDDPEYAVKNLRKLSAYHKNGYFEGVNFIQTMEGSKAPISTRELDYFIQTYLL